MMTRRFVYSAGFLAAFSAVACAPEASELVGATEQRIINGELDTTHQAVVAVFSEMGKCTGTIVYATGGAAYVLTAAHCFGSGPIQVVMRGNDYEKPDQVLQVVDYKVHPLYTDKDLAYDFAIMKAKYAADDIAQILPMAPAEDKMKPGTAMEHVGYGLISYPGGDTTLRHHVMGQIDMLSQLQLSYNQPSSGPCSGDSGGPGLVETPFGTRVAGVVSFGDAECKAAGVSGRVSGVYKAFILPFIGGLPNDGVSGSSTSVSASASTGGATSSTDAAVSSSAATGGAGGAPGTTSGAGADETWTAGNLKPTEHSGDIVTSSCALAARASETESSRGTWLFAAAFAFALSRRRRRD